MTLFSTSEFVLNSLKNVGVIAEAHPLRKFEFVANLKTANQAGLTIPNVLAPADKVIK